MILFEKKYQTFDTVFHHQMKHLEVCQKYSAACRIFNSLLGVSSGDETLRLMFDILLYSMYTVGANMKREMVLSPNDEEVASSKKHTQFKTRVHKSYPISDQNGRNWHPISVQNG